MYLLTLLYCFVGFAVGAVARPGQSSEFLDGTLLFRTRNSDFLERSILHGKILSREEIRDASGLRSLEVRARHLPKPVSWCLGNLRDSLSRPRGF
jgi:hypothetical protein